MTTYPEAFDRMLEAWHEKDPQKVRGHLEASLAADIYFVDPKNEVRGLDDFEKMVHAFQAEYPTAEFVRASRIDGHHDFYRYHWEMRVDGQTVLPGFDVSQVNAEGKVCQIFGFFGPLDAA